MIRGIQFQIQNGFEKIFKFIFTDIDVNKYNWINIESDDQVFNLNDNNFLFTQLTYTGNEFKKIISKNNYYAVFVNLQAFSSKCFNAITTYGEFINSDCEIILLITDSIFVDIYAKDFKIIEVIKKNAYKNGFSNIRYITDENDTRTKITAI